MDEFENITIDDITASHPESSQLGPTNNNDYIDLPDLEPFNLDTITELAVHPDDLQFARDNLSGLLNRLEHTIPSADTRQVPGNGHETNYQLGSAYHRKSRYRKQSRPEIINYGTIIYSSLPATENPHVAKWLNKFTQVLETIYEHEPRLGEQSHDKVISGVLEGLYDYSAKIQNK